MYSTSPQNISSNESMDDSDSSLTHLADFLNFDCPHQPLPLPHSELKTEGTARDVIEMREDGMGWEEFEEWTCDSIHSKFYHCQSDSFIYSLDYPTRPWTRLSKGD
jgi:hypothetical protein